MTSDELLRRHADHGQARAARACAGAPARPALQTVIVTCMDVRIDVYTLFGLRPGEAHVLRNAGGIVTDDVVRSIANSQRKLGSTDVLVVHHSGCGMATFTDDEFSDEIAGDCGFRPPWRPGTFRDVHAAVAAGVRRLHRSPYLRPGTPVRGFVLDVDTFALVEVPVAVREPG
ncbi:MAG: beta-class carbonic anhydrase [Pseudonocardia sp.]